MSLSVAGDPNRDIFPRLRSDGGSSAGPLDLWADFQSANAIVALRIAGRVVRGASLLYSIRKRISISGKKFGRLGCPQSPRDEVYKSYC